MYGHALQYIEDPSEGADRPFPTSTDLGQQMTRPMARRGGLAEQAFELRLLELPADQRLTDQLWTDTATLHRLALVVHA